MNQDRIKVSQADIIRLGDSFTGLQLGYDVTGRDLWDKLVDIVYMIPSENEKGAEAPM